MVSSFYPEEGRGKRMDIFAERLKGFKQVYSFRNIEKIGKKIIAAR
ncbi:MAG: hypothetical protein K2L17_13160 [Muribaculaceae bacterium]|nr:hypothetical protein [Muribaculaceae bacterium]MDE6786986.1 hypothetical protein [Muribaculaceae bacterium]